MDKKPFPLWILIYRNLFLIIICFIVGMGAFGTYSKVKKKPSYIASKQVILSADLDPTKINANTASNSISLAGLLLPTISDNIRSIKASEIVNREYKATSKYKYNNTNIYGGSIGVSYSNDSLLFKISYTDVNKDIAKEKLDCIIESFEVVFKEFKDMDEKLISAGEIGIISVENGVTISTSSPLKRDIILGGCAGLAFAIVIIIIRYLLDNKVKTEEEIFELTGESVMAFLEK